MPTIESSSKPIGIVLLQFGGPDSLEAVKPFLYNLFNDSDIIELPFGRLLQPLFASLLSWSRAKVVRKEYAEMGGKSPIVEITAKQAASLQKALDEMHGVGATRVITAMRYWNPLTEVAMKQLLGEGISDIVLLPLYAQYSKANAGSSFNEWERAKNRLGGNFNERRVIEYKTQPKYLASLNARIDEALLKFEHPDDVFFLFSAHGTPVDFVEKGDPYSFHIQDTIEALMKLRGFDHAYQLAYQSKIGPKRWLEPATTETIKKLGESGMKNMLVIPIAFTSDHIETIQELGEEEKENAEEHGIENFIVTEGLNDSPLFIQALVEVVNAELSILRPDRFVLAD